MIPDSGNWSGFFVSMTIFSKPVEVAINYYWLSNVRAMYKEICEPYNNCIEYPPFLNLPKNHFSSPKNILGTSSVFFL